MILGLNRNAGWKKNEITESRRELPNPGRGWYHLYTYNIAEPIDWLYVACEEEQLVLLLMDIGAYRDTDIPAQALDYIRRVLGFFADRKKTMIIRFAYDTEGHGMQREPSDIARVKRHIIQLSEPVSEFTEHILCLQGVLTGDWGEMHGSKFLSPEKLRVLAETSLRANPGCFLAVRMPKQYRMLAGSLPAELSDRLTLFNDGMFGSDTDLGTYAADTASDGEGAACWSRSAELVWQDENMTDRPCGGEAVAGAAYGETGDEQDLCRQIIADLRHMHTDYLNSTYDTALLDRWKSMKVTERGGYTESLYDHIGTRLGYRFVVRDAAFKKNRLIIKVENVGFGNLLSKAECRLIIRKADEPDIRLTAVTDPRSWKSGSVSSVEVPLDRTAVKNARVYIQLEQSCPERVIYFANEPADIDGAVLLGCF